LLRKKKGGPRLTSCLPVGRIGRKGGEGRRKCRPQKEERKRAGVNQCTDVKKGEKKRLEQEIKDPTTASACDQREKKKKKGKTVRVFRLSWRGEFKKKGEDAGVFSIQPWRERGKKKRPFGQRLEDKEGEKKNPSSF